MHSVDSGVLAAHICRIKPFVMKRNILFFGVLAAAAISIILSSPKWSFWVFDWLTPICLLAFFRLAPVRRKAILAFPALVLAHYLASLGVAPYPPVVLFILCIYESLVQLALYGLDAWVMRRSDRPVATLFFPALAVGFEFLNSTYGGGVWWSAANTQFELTWLTQMASITGIWGISFLLYWNASVAVRAFAARRRGGWNSGLGVYGVVLSAIVVGGCIRYSGSATRDRKVKVAGVSVPLIGLYEAFCSDYDGRHLVLDPKASVGDPAMGLVGKAEGNYVETADSVRYRNANLAIHSVNDSLFALSQRAVDKGAQIVTWSEGNGIGWTSDEPALVRRGQQFAARDKVYLLMTLCLVHPGKITPGKKFLENEAVFIGPDGQVLTIFHKNNPVPMVEASQPGNGRIPVIQTPYGRVAVSICYDADQVKQMQQLGHQGVDLLLLPSGDWYAISPYHSYMAIYRGVENGCSIFREVSNGLSIATDYRGKPVGTRDWFRDGASWWMADLPVGHVNTAYSRVGDALVFGCLIFVALSVVVLLFLRTRKSRAPLVKSQMALQP